MYSIITPYLTQSVTLKKKTGIDAYGRDIYQTSTVPARVIWETQLITDKIGENVVSKGRLYTTEQINIGDCVSIGGKDYKILAISTVSDMHGKEVFRVGWL